jgi:hypothetical protein
MEDDFVDACLSASTGSQQQEGGYSWSRWIRAHESQYVKNGARK